jgi:hypothetical protein
MQCNTAVEDADKTDLMDNVFKYINKAEDFDQCNGNENKIKIQVKKNGDKSLTCNFTVMSS